MKHYELYAGPHPAVVRFGYETAGQPTRKKRTERDKTVMFT